MQLISQSVSLVTENNPFKRIELAGRVSHKSEERITEESYKIFFLGMLKAGHTATLEFADVYLEMDIDVLKKTNNEELEDYYYLANIESDFCDYCKVTHELDGTKRVYTNLRFLLDKFPTIFEDFVNAELPDCVITFIPDNNDPYKRYCFNIVTNRGISHELVRHRVLSPLQESTRYVRYDGKMLMITPHWMTDFDVPVINKESNRKLDNCDEDSIQWHKAISMSEKIYAELIGQCQLKPQDGRGVLPNDLKTELYITGYLKDWIGHIKESISLRIWNEEVIIKQIKGFDTLRNDIAAHPQAREIAELTKSLIVHEIGRDSFNDIKSNYYE